MMHLKKHLKDIIYYWFYILKSTKYFNNNNNIIIDWLLVGKIKIPRLYFGVYFSFPTSSWKKEIIDGGKKNSENFCLSVFFPENFIIFSSQKILYSKKNSTKFSSLLLKNLPNSGYHKIGGKNPKKN
jgi:hypothetical protein